MGLREEANEEFDRARAAWPELGYLAVNALMRAAFARDWPRMEALIANIRRHGPHTETLEEAIRQAEAIRVFGPAEAPASIRMARAWLAKTGRFNVGIHMLCREGFADEAFALVQEASFDHLFQPGGRIAGRGSGEGPTPNQVVFVGLPSLFITPGEAMRADPRFVRLCGKLGLVDYWVRTERWPDCAEEVPYDFRSECFRWWR